MRLHRNPIIAALICCVLALASISTAISAAAARQYQPGAPTQSSAQLLFIGNVGQFDPAVRYHVYGAKTSLWLVDDGLWLSASAGEPGARSRAADQDRSSRADAPARSANIRLRFVGANPAATIVPLSALDTRVSYLYGSDPSRWLAGVPVWSGVRYADLYPGVDLEIVGVGASWAWRAVARDSSALAQVRLQIDGANQASIGQGKIVLKTEIGMLALPLVASDRASLQSAQIVARDSGVEIVAPFGMPSPANPNPDVAVAAALGYGTFVGGERTDWANAVAVDATGAAYVTGTTNTASFPTTPGSDTTFGGGYDVFVSKFRPDGSGLVYSTFVGGSQYEEAFAITLDGAGAAYLTGWTSSPNFPTTSSAFDRTLNGSADTFVAKLTPSGTSLAYGTYLGGQGQDSARGLWGSFVAVDSGGAAYVVGKTDSPDYPVTSGAFDTTYNGGTYDVFASKLSPNGGALVYSTFIGSSGSDEATTVAVDSQGAAYVAGRTDSPQYPTTASAFDRTHNGGWDGFVTKLSPTGAALGYSTFLGSGATDRIYAIAVDSGGAAYVSGVTFQGSFPTTAGAYDPTFNGERDVFVTKLNAVGSGLVYSTFLGGSAHDATWGMAIDSAGAVYLVGLTFSANFPTTANAFDRSYNAGWDDAFYAKLGSGGDTLLYSTFLGGGVGDTNRQWSDEAYGVAVDLGGNAYVVGFTESPDFPTTAGAFDRVFDNDGAAPGSDGFLAKFGPGTPPPPTPIPTLTPPPVPSDDSAYTARYDGWRGAEYKQGGGYRWNINTGQTITYTTVQPVTSLAVISYRGPDQGKAQVLIDGVDRGVIDLYAATPETQFTRWYTGLSNTTHTIVVKVLGQKNAASRGTEVRIDGFRVGSGTIDDSELAVRLNAWSGTAQAGSLGGAYHSAATTGASVYFNVTGTSFALISARGPAYGKAEIYVDNVLKTTLDLYGPAQQWQYQQTISGLSNQAHLIRVRVLGARNALSSANTVVFDGYVDP